MARTLRTHERFLIWGSIGAVLIYVASIFGNWLLNLSNFKNITHAYLITQLFWLIIFVLGELYLGLKNEELK